MEGNFSYKFYSTTQGAWDGMYQAIFAAKHSIEWELYMLIDDIVGVRFVDLLCEKASAGVEVRLILDALGSLALSGAAITRLRQAGVFIAWFHQFKLELNFVRWFKRVWRRNHRKVLIVDQESIFIGGVNIVARSASWHDLHVYIHGEGPAKPLVKEFEESFVHAGGVRRPSTHHRRRFARASINVARWWETFDFILHSPSHKPGRRQLWQHYVEALRGAHDRFDLVTPYFVPNQEFMRFLAAAVKRGVVVNILVPLRTDVRLMQYIAQPFLSAAELSGAHIYFSRVMNHGKAVCVDQSYGVVGSANLTPRSLHINEEAGVCFSHPDMVRDLRLIIDGWIAVAVPLTRVGHYSRSLWQQWWCWLAARIKNYV